MTLGLILFMFGFIGTIVSDDDSRWLALYGICLVSGFLVVAITGNIGV